jgi:hypothetical protein
VGNGRSAAAGAERPLSGNGAARSIISFGQVKRVYNLLRFAIALAVNREEFVVELFYVFYSIGKSKA